MDAGTVIDQGTVLSQGLRAAAEPAESDANLVAGGEGVRVVSAQGLRVGLDDLAVGLQRLLLVFQLAKYVGDFMAGDEGVAVARPPTPYPGRAGPGAGLAHCGLGFG